VVELIEYALSCVPLSPAKAVPPEGARYHLNDPPVPATDAIGMPIPHCVELVATGAGGTGFTDTFTDCVEVQPLAVFVAVTIYVVFPEGVTVTTFPLKLPGFHAQLKLPGPTVLVIPANCIFGR